jgi:hypothetical protein
MKSLFVILVFVALFLESQAQDIGNVSVRSYAPYRMYADPLAYQDNVMPPGLRKQKIGSRLAIFGTASFVGGILLINSGFSKNRSVNYGNGVVGYSNAGEGEVYVGSLLVQAGLGMFIPGMIIKSKGKKQFKRYLESERQRNQQTISLGASGQGLSIKYKF